MPIMVKKAVCVPNIRCRYSPRINITKKVIMKEYPVKKDMIAEPRMVIRVSLRARPMNRVACTPCPGIPRRYL